MAQAEFSSGTAAILMCPPEHYGVEYEINPWMSRAAAPDRSVARRQWDSLHECLIKLGVVVELIEPQPGLPDMVFTANAGLVWKETVFLSRFRYSVRAPETAYFERWFRAHGFQPRRLPEGCFFEGAGDALFCGETLVAGYRFRSDVLSHQWVAKQIGCPLVVAELVNPYFYHLDTCFCPLRPDTALWYPYAFDEYGRRAITRVVENLIETPAQEAYRFACNAVVVGDHVILSSGCPTTAARLEQQGFTCHAIDLSEFHKAGGSAKCLTLRLDGEDAAAWRRTAPPSDR